MAPTLLATGYKQVVLVPLRSMPSFIYCWSMPNGDDTTVTNMPDATVQAECATA